MTDKSWDEMPIESFGKALLRGMGWQPGKAIGLNTKGPVAAVEYVPRHQRLGLGATPKPPEQKQKRFIKPGETRLPKEDLVPPASTTSRWTALRWTRAPTQCRTAGLPRREGAGQEPQGGR